MERQKLLLTFFAARRKNDRRQRKLSGPHTNMRSAVISSGCCSNFNDDSLMMNEKRNYGHVIDRTKSGIDTDTYTIKNHSIFHWGRRFCNRVSRFCNHSFLVPPSNNLERLIGGSNERKSLIS